MSLPRSAQARLAELGERFAVPAAGVQALGRILELQATDPAASTTVRAPRDAADRHVADSLVALDLAPVRAATRVADLGAGAGWPGLALAAALPGARVALVESASRHCRYLERAVEAGGLGNAEVVHARAEDWPAGVGAHDLVTARALAALPVAYEYASPLLALGGHVVAWKGDVGVDEAADGAVAAALLGLEPLAVRRTEPFPEARSHVLHLLRKTAATPDRFPRRAGMATKRPISAPT